MAVISRPRRVTAELVGDGQLSECPDCHVPLTAVAVANGDGATELVCQGCGFCQDMPTLSFHGQQFGRSPKSAMTMDDNLGTSPGPERNRQVMSALNMNHRGPTGLEFHQLKLSVLQIWKFSSDPTDRAASNLLSQRFRTIQSRRGPKLPQERIEAIARVVKAGLRQAEKKQRLTPKQIRLCVDGVLSKEGLLPQ